MEVHSDQPLNMQKEWKKKLVTSR